MRLKNPQVAGQASAASYAGYKQKSIVNPKFLITLEMLLMLVVLVWLGVNLFFTLNPFYLQQLQQEMKSLSVNQEILVNKIQEMQDVYVVDDSVELRTRATAATMDIVSRVEDGDYIIELGDDNIMIFRSADEQVVYFGPELGLVEEVLAREIDQEILTLATQQGIVSEDRLPEVDFIEDISTLLRSNGTLYANADVGDVVAYFLEEGQVVVYDPQTKAILATGSLNISPIAQ